MVRFALGRYLGSRCFIGLTGYTCAVSYDAHDFVFHFVAGVVKTEAKADGRVSVCMYISTSSCHQVQWRASRAVLGLVLSLKFVAYWFLYTTEHQKRMRRRYSNYEKGKD